MTELNLSLRLNAEFAQAKAEVAAMRDRLRDLGLEAGQSGQRVTGAGAAIGDVAPAAALTKQELASLAGGWAGLVTSLDPAIGAAIRFEEAEQLVNRAVAAGVTTAEEGQAKLQLLAEKLGLADTSAEEAAASARLAEAAYASLMAGIDPLEAASQRFAQAQDIVDLALAAGVISADQAGAALERYAISLGLAEDMGERQVQETARLAAGWTSLRASLDPAVAAEMRFAEAQTLVNRAIAAGVATTAEGKAALDGLALKLGLAEAAAEGAASAQMRLQGSAGASAGAMGNLAAQWNDVVMMALAGQNPFQLAIQQGTQITQVFGGAGAAGALRMLGASALSLLNPFNLLVIGGIAAGTALVQWFMSAGGEVKTVEDAVGGLEDAIADLRTEAGRDLAALKEDFGEVTPEVQELQEALTRLAADNAIETTVEAMRALRAETQGRWRGLFSGTFTDAGATEKLIGDQPEVKTQVNGMTVFTKPTEERFFSALDTAANSEGLAAQLAALEEVKASFLDATKGQDTLTEAQRAFLKGVLDTEAGLRRLIAAQTESARAGGAQDSPMVGELAQGVRRPRDPAAREAAREDLAEANRLRAELKAEADIQAVISRYGEDSWRVTVARVAAERQAYQLSLIQLGVSGEELRSDMARWDAAKGIVAERQKLQQTVIDPVTAALDRADDAGKQVALLRQQAELQQLIADYGEDSLVVALARVSAERKVFEEQQRAAGQSGVVLDNLMDAWDAANGLASVDISAKIAAALGPASQLAEYLRQAAGYWGAAQGLLQRASESGGWIGGIVSRLGLGATPQAPMTSPPPRVRPAGFGVDMDGDGVPDAAQTGGSSGGRGAGRGDTVASLRTEARELMTELDRDIATIQEKLRAGLIDQAEATDAVRQAKDRAANRLAELVPQLAAMGEGGAAAVTEWRQQLDGLAEDLKDTGTDLSEVLTEGFKSPFKEFLKGAADGQEAMDAFADHVIDRLADIAAEQLATGVLEPMMTGLFSGFAGLGGTGVTLEAKGDVFQSGRIVPFANGGAPTAPLSAWLNQVVSQPTLFPMADGVGLMGEAGQEAIMPVGDGGVLAVIGGRETRLPLTRGAGGRLGVAVPEEADPRRAIAARFGIALDAPDAWRPAALDRPPVAFAQGGVLAAGNEQDVARVRGAAAVQSGAAAAAAVGGFAMPAPVVNLGVKVEGVPAGHTAQVQQTGSGADLDLRIVIEEVSAALAQDVHAGRGPLPASIQQSFGLPRVPR